MTLKPDVTVAAIVQREGRFLLVEERAARRLVLNQPAGHLEAGESLIEAVVREALEETAWRFSPRGADRHLSLEESSERPRVSACRICRPRRASSALTVQLDRGILRTLWLTRE